MLSEWGPTATGRADALDVLRRDHGDLDTELDRRYGRGRPRLRHPSRRAERDHAAGGRGAV